MRSGRSPLQNRVTPFGDVVAIAQRGLFIGNRGIIHDPATKTLLGRRWTTKAWLVCVLDYKGRHREVMGGRTWTELVALAEITKRKPILKNRVEAAIEQCLTRAAGPRSCATTHCARLPCQIIEYS